MERTEQDGGDGAASEISVDRTPIDRIPVGQLDDVGGGGFDFSGFINSLGEKMFG
ncbi:hypothetical protein ACFOGJ_10335 [Marinibaculum pumilum]|uniref:Uncharacterized protein n=1 Tax=Marinibaculum pumilum TaxID=1766165 RepID=A0ABV7KZU3_9PROT